MTKNTRECQRKSSQSIVPKASNRVVLIIIVGTTGSLRETTAVRHRWWWMQPMTSFLQKARWQAWSLPFPEIQTHALEWRAHIVRNAQQITADEIFWPSLVCSSPWYHEANRRILQQSCRPLTPLCSIQGKSVCAKPIVECCICRQDQHWGLVAVLQRCNAFVMRLQRRCKDAEVFKVYW